MLYQGTFSPFGIGFGKGFVAASGGVAFVLNASNGLFLETGTPVTLKAARTFTAGSGTFVETGSAVTLEHGYDVVAGSGTYVLTGTAATLTADTLQTLTIADNASGVAITGGDAFQYSCQYTNTGTFNATAVSVAITLDASLTYVSSSGTGWTIGVAGQVVTATQASIAPGAASPILINVTTGGSALTATTTGAATATDASTANASHDVTVNLVHKDAALGWYFPASSTEWGNFRTRKGLNAATPNGLWLMQEASGNLADSIGSLTLTAGGTGLSYQQTLTGVTRKAVSFTDADSGHFTVGAGTGPNPASTSVFWVCAVILNSTPAAVRNILSGGGAAAATEVCAELTTTPRLRGKCLGNTADGAASPTGTMMLVGVKYDRTGSHAVIYGNADKLVPTYGSGVTDSVKGFGATQQTSANMSMIYGFEYNGSNAEIADADVKALWQAIGAPVSWS